MPGSALAAWDLTPFLMADPPLCAVWRVVLCVYTVCPPWTDSAPPWLLHGRAMWSARTRGQSPTILLRQNHVLSNAPTPTHACTDDDAMRNTAEINHMCILYRYLRTAKRAPSHRPTCEAQAGSRLEVGFSAHSSPQCREIDNDIPDIFVRILFGNDIGRAETGPRESAVK